MPRRLGRKLMLSITMIVIIVAAVSGLVNVKTEERQLLDTMVLGADQLSKGITSATWHAMLDDHREAAYEVMQTIALKQGIDRIRMFNRAGQVMFSTRREDPQPADAAPVRPHAARPHPLGRRPPPPRDAHAHLQRALVQPGRLPCASRRRESARRARPAVEPRNRGPRGLQHEVPRAAGHRRRNHPDRPVHHLFHPPLPQPADREADRRRQGGQPHGARQADRHRRQQRGDLRAGVAFDVMRERLGSALGEINQFTQKLEIKVEERTQQLQAAQKKLLHSDRLASLGQLSASVAHEINNPISGVLNLSMLLQRMLKPTACRPSESRSSASTSAGDQRDRARRPHRLRPAGVLAPLQAAARPGRPQPHRQEHALARAAQDEAQQRRGGDAASARPAGRAVRRLADPAGRAEPAAECRRGDPGQAGAARHRRDRGRRRRVVLTVADNGEGMLRRTSPRFSTRSSPPNRKERASASASPSPTESSRRTAAISR